jgi:competence protein ComEC
MRLLAWAALAILALTPESLLSVSFQMSFGAVVALIAAYESLGPRLAAWRRQGGPLRLAALYLAGVAVTTLVAGLATAPFAAYHFNQASHYSLAANLLAVPLTALWIMPWAVIAYLLLPFGLDGLALAPMGAGIDAMLWVAATVAGWPGAVSRPASPGPAALALVVLGGLWLCLWCGRWRWFGSIVVAAGIGLGAGARPPDMLIDGEGRLAAVLTASGGLDFSRATNGYESETWLRRVGMFEAAAAGSFVCDRLGCIATRQGITIAYVGDARALEEDCRRADIVLSAVPVRRRCPSARLVIDRFDLWREGAHAVWLDGTALTVRTAAELRGNRPWSPARGAARWRRQS